MKMQSKPAMLQIRRIRQMDRRKPELLCPAGDMEKLRMAVAYGADAVYLAGTSFGMRSFTANFTPDELPQAIRLAHNAGVKVHCTVNIMPRNDSSVIKKRRFIAFL